MTRTDDLLDHVVCPACGSDLASVTEQLRCARGHVYPVVSGVPRLLTWTEDAKATASTFTQQWAQFDYEQDRTWGGTAAERLAAFLDDVGKPPDWFAGKCVLDAGCGNGVLSHAISSLGCRVVATDLSESVVAAHRRFGEAVLFFQGDLGRSALRSRTFDLIYCGGVLHHTPSTRAALEQLVRALRPGGTIFLSGCTQRFRGSNTRSRRHCAGFLLPRGGWWQSPSQRKAPSRTA